MENYKCKSVGIIGSGIQGVCTGLQLIKKGIPVTIFDRHDPLSKEFKAASYGNAGHFSPYAVLQFNRPDILYDVPKMLISSYGPLALKWNYIPKMLNWFLHYFKNCNQKSMMHTAKNMHQILSLSNDAYEEIFQEIDTTGLVEKKGIIYIWTNKNLKSRKLEIKVRNELVAYGVSEELYDMDRVGKHLSAEEYNFAVEYFPKLFRDNDDWAGTGCHINFSTPTLREGGDNKRYIDDLLVGISEDHKKHIKVYGAGNEHRLTGKNETSHIDSFEWGDSDRSVAMRIPHGANYIEDRRPGGNINPYEAFTALIESIVSVDSELSTKTNKKEKATA